MSTRNSRGPSILGRKHTFPPAGDHQLGESAYPGGRSWAARPENRVFTLPVANDALIFPGDVVTQVTTAVNASATQDNPAEEGQQTSGSIRAVGYVAPPVSVGTTGVNRGYGDMSGGVYQALNFVDNRNRADGMQAVSVYGAPALIDVVLDNDIRVGSLVGSDLRPKGTASARGTAGGTGVAWNEKRLTDETLFMRVRSLTAAEAVATTDTGKSFVGKLVSISSGVSTDTLTKPSTVPAPPVSTAGLQTTKIESDLNDVGVVQVGVGR